jgi:hypothetical protein
MQQNIFALVIEIHRVAALAIPKSIPVIALCNFDSPQNWVSQGLVDYFAAKLGKPDHDPHLKHALVKISWSCERLGQFNQEGSFLVEANAKLKIVFGCGQLKLCSPIVSSSRTDPLPGPARISHPRRSKKDPCLSNEAVKSFHDGVENRALLRLRRVSSIVLDQTLNETVEELEETLEMIYSTGTLDNQALSTSDSQNVNANTNQMALCNATFPTMTIHSSSDSTTTETSEFTNGVSTNTSISTAAPHHKRATRPSLLVHNRDVALDISDMQRDRLFSWQNQSTSDDPTRWLCSQIPESKYEHSLASVSGSVTPRTDNLDERAPKLLDEATLLADHAANEYWTWDEEACRFKHFDHGSDVPVWYSPPVT